MLLGVIWIGCLMGLLFEFWLFVPQEMKTLLRVLRDFLMTSLLTEFLPPLKRLADQGAS